MASDEQLHLSVILPLRNQQALQALLVRLSDPKSPDYRHFLSVQEFTDQFGPTQQDYDAVASYLQTSGLTVDAAPANRLVVPVHGAVAQINSAFHVQMSLYQHPKESRTFFSTNQAPSMGLATPVQHITGLDNFSLPQPMVVRGQGVSSSAVLGSGPGGSYLGSDMRAAYYGGSALTGTGQAVGLVEFGGYNLSDVNLTFSNAGQSYSVPVNNVLLDGATGGTNAYGDGEQVLDIVQAIGMAPSLSQVRVYIGVGSDDTAVLTSIATENIVKQIGCSWGWIPVDPAADEPLFQEMAAQGQTFFTASGDSGAFDAYISPYFYPSEDPYVITVGGTHLITTAAAGGWSSETVWNSSSGTSSAASGGGISPDGLVIPSYQTGVANSANGGSTTLRNVPDLAMEADFDNYNCSGSLCSGTWAGTSFATPRWAGFLALVNQQASQNGTTNGLGFINPTLYNLGEGTNASQDFHDITSGNNLTQNQPAWYSAVVGYDLTTGWGSPNGQSLINDLTGATTAGFWLESSQSTVYINPGYTGTTTIRVNDTGGFNGAVTLAVTSTLPPGVTASFSTNPATGSSVLTLSAANNVNSQSVNVTVTGTSGSVTETTSFGLVVHPPSFQLASNYSAVSVNINGTATSTVSVVPQYGFSGAVALSISGLPSGVTAVFSPTSTANYSSLKFTASATAGAGTTNVTITGTAGSLTSSITLPLTVIGPSILLQGGGSVSLGIGNSGSTYVDVISENGFTGNVSLSATNLPKGVTAVFASNPLSLTNNSSALDTVTFYADGTASAGQATITIQGVSGTLSSTITISVTVGVPTFTLNTSSPTVGLGSSGSTYVSISPQYGFTGSVLLSVSGLPAGVTATWAGNPVTSNASSTLALSVSSTATPGQYPLTITGTYGSQTVTTTSTLTVAGPSFQLSTNSVALGIGSTTTDYVYVYDQYGFSGTVTFAVSGLPSGVTGTFSPASSTYSTNLNLSASSSAVAGTYTVTVTGTSGAVSAKTTFTLTIGQPSFTLTGSSYLTVGQGGTGSASVYVNDANGFNGSVNLSVSGLPSGVTATFSPTSTTYYSNLNFAATSTAATGQYTVTITGTSGSLTASTSIILTVGVPGFTLTSYLYNTVPVGGTASGYVYANATNGFSGNITMSASGLPAGLTAAFSPNPTTYQSNIAFTAASTLAPGTYSITVTGTSGSLTASTVLSVVVGSPSFTVNGPGSINMGESSTSPNNFVYINSVNGFSGSVTFAVSGLPAGVTAGFTTNPTTYSTYLSLTSSAAAALGTSTITITGTSGSLTASTTFTLTISAPSFAISTPYSLTVNPGSTSSGTVTVTDQFGFNGNISYAVSGLPNGVTATVSPNPSATNPQLTLAAASSTTPGAYTYILTGTSGTLSASSTGYFSVNTPSYSIRASKALVSVPIGGTAATSIVVVSTNGFSGGVSLVVTGLPSGVTATFNPATDTGTSTLTFTATSTATLGYSNIVIAGTYGGAISQTTLLLDVVPAQSATTTAVTFSAAGSSVTSVPVGTLVTATISVLAGSTPVTAGTVYLCNASVHACNGTYQVASAQLTSAGTATVKFIPGATASSYVAAYAATTANAASVSAASPLTVTASIPTATTLAQTGSSGNYTLTATTTATGDVPPTGTMAFLDTTTNNAVLATLSVASSTSGVTQSGAQTLSAGYEPRYSVAADFNGDGYPDLAVSNTGGTTVSIFLNNKGTFTAGTSLTLTSAPTSITTGDFNGDGKMDIAVSEVSINDVAVFLGNGDGTFSSPVLYPTSPGPYGLVAGDFNRDGNLDLAVVTSSTALTLLLGNGDGTFTTSNVSPSIPYYAQGISQADFNGDGILDLIVASGSYDDFEVLLGNGDGTFSALTPVNASNYPVLVDVADFNQDGVPDIATASAYGYAPAVYLGNGDGTFTAGAAPPFTGNIYSIATADINGDGIPDLVGTNTGGSTVVTLAGKGDGTFTGAATASTGSNPEFVVLGDWNGDGITDIAVPNYYSSSVTVMTTQLTQTVAATVTGISPDGTGPHKIAATYSGDAAYVSSTSASITLNATPGAPAITVTPASSSITYAQPLNVGISVSGVSGDPVPTGSVTVSSGSYTSASTTLSSGTASVTVPAATLATGTDTLTVTYTPDNASTGTYTSASGTASVSVAKLTPSVTVIPGVSSVSTTATLSVAVTVTDSTGTGAPTGSVTLSSGSYTSTASALNSGSANFTVPPTTLTAGQDKLTVVYAPDSASAATYNTSSGTVNVTVTQATPAVVWTTPAAVTYGTALSATQLNATSSIPGTFAYSPALGTILPSGNQTLSVIFTPTDTVNYTNATASVTLSVLQAAPAITWTAPAAITYGTALSATQLNATSTVAGTFTYLPKVGTVLGAGNQTLNVTFTPTDSTNYSTVTGSVTLTVSKAATSVMWSTPAAITYGTALSATQLNAASSVPGTFSYSPAIGTVLGAGNQTLSVTFTPTDFADYSTSTGSVTLTVNKATTSVTWSTPAAITYSTALSATQLNATSTVAGSFAYSPAIGTVLGVGSQTLNVTFTPTDSADYNTSTGSVTLTVNKAATSVTWPTPAAITYGTALSATQLNATSTVAGSFAYSPAIGTVLGVGSQTLNVTFTPTDSTDYNTSTGSVTLTVNKTATSVTWPTPAAITYGTALSATQLDATSTVAGSFAYSPAIGAVLGAGSQTLNVTFTPTDSIDYSMVTGSVTLIVNKAATSIAWPTPTAITYGTALSATQLNATSTVAGTFAYSPALGAVLSAGSQTLNVTFTPTDSTDYSTVTGSATLTVNKAALSITANSVSRTYGATNPGFTGTVLGAVNNDAFSESFSTTATIASAPGSYAIVPAVTGTNAVDYAIAPTNGTLAITPAATATSFALSNQNLTFTAAVTTVVAGTPTGSVTFYQGQTSLGTGTLSNGVASITLSAFPAAGAPLSAQYGGDANFSASTSASVAVLAMGLGSSSLTVASGGSVTDSFTVSVPSGYTGTVQLACAGLPQYASCTFQPSALSFTGATSTATGTLTISTITQASLTPLELKPRNGHPVEYAMLFLLPGLLCAFGRRRKSLGSLTACIFFLLCASASLCGCAGGGSSGGGTQTYKSPTGNYSVVITATGPGGVSQSTITLTVQ